MSDPETSRNIKKMVEAGYDKVALEYDRLDDDASWPRMRWLEKLLRVLPQNSAVLDLGCGSGDPADIEIAKLHRITGVDISQAQVALARQNVPTGTFIGMDAGPASFPPETFDAVVFFYTMEHLPRREHAELLTRIGGYTKRKGYLLIGTEAADYDDVTAIWLGVPMFLSIYEPGKTKALVQDAGYQIIESSIEQQVENGKQIEYLWIFAQKR